MDEDHQDNNDQISTEDLNKRKYTLKTELIKNQTKYFQEIVNREKPTKSKLKHLMDHKQN